MIKDPGGMRRIARSFVLFPIAVGGAAALLVWQLAPALRLGFCGDDFELLALARTGGFAGAVLPAPERGMFAKPVVSAVWAALLPLFGLDTRAWFSCLIATHLLDAAIFGWLVARLMRGWIEPVAPAPPSAGTAVSAAPAASSASAISARWAGLAAAVVWAVHDRLLEPVFSLAAWNHSLAFATMLAALLLLEAALAHRSVAAMRLFALAQLVSLLTYEVAISLPVTAALLVAFAPRSQERPSARARFALPALAGSALLYGVIRVMLQWRTPGTSYAFVSLATVPGQVGEIVVAFLRLPAVVTEAAGGSGTSVAARPVVWMLGLAASALAVAGLAFVRDRLTRFACGWFLVSSLVVALLPDTSDRHHYVPFAALVLLVVRAAWFVVAPGREPSVVASPALSRAAFARGALALAVTVHLVWSVAAAREQVLWWALKDRFHERLVAQARSAVAGLPPGAIVAVAWPERAEPGHDILDVAARLPRRFASTTWPLYLRPAAVDQLVSAADLLTVAAVPSGPFFRRPEPARAASALETASFRLVDIEPARAASGPVPHLPPEALVAAFHARREIPVALSLGDAAWRIAWLEPVGRSEAFEAEYRPRD